MIRAPVINTLLNARRTAWQIISSRNAFDDVVAYRGAEKDVAIGRRLGAGTTTATATHPPGGGEVGSRPLDLRDLSSNLLLFSACRQAWRALRGALAKSDAAAAEARLSHLEGLVRLGDVLANFGMLRPWLSFGLRTKAKGWFSDGMREGLARGLVAPGATRSIGASSFLDVHVDAPVHELMAKERQQAQKLHAAVHRGFAGSGRLELGEDDLDGLPDVLKKTLKPTLGSRAMRRSTRYSLPVGQDAMNKVMPFCHSATTRTRLFEAYYANFGTNVNELALDLLRTRRELAQRLGFSTWAEYELRPLSVGSPAKAQELMDQCWSDVQPSLASLLRRMEQLRPAVRTSDPVAAQRPGGGHAFPTQVAHADEALLRALATREADSFKLYDFLPADSVFPRLLEIVGRAYNVHLVEAHQPQQQRLANGWHKSVRVFEVFDGPPATVAASGGASRRIGFVYTNFDRQRRTLFSTPASLPATTLICHGHAYVALNFRAASRGRLKLLNPTEVAAIAHEFGHAVHMLCHRGTIQELEDQPLDLAELPSILVETIVRHPSVVPQYAKHYASGGLPPDALVGTVRNGPHYFVRFLQDMNVVMGLHGEAFDPHRATPAELQDAAVALWQRYSPVTAHPGFTPLGGQAGIYLGLGAQTLAYLLCHLRVDAILHTQQGARDGAAARSDEAARRWLSPEFAGRVRAQLLDRAFTNQWQASLLPPVLPAHGAGASAPAAGGNMSAHPVHPLPPPPMSAAALFAHAQHPASA